MQPSQFAAKRANILPGYKQLFGCILMVLFMVALTTQSSPSKVWIYFTDKGSEVENMESFSQIPRIIKERSINLKRSNSRSDDWANSPLNVPISEKALQRRRKVLAALKEDHTLTKSARTIEDSSSLYSIHDAPIFEDYVDGVKSILRTDQKIGVRSSWLNAITVADISEDQLKKLQNLPFVLKVEKVASFKKSTELESEQVPVPRSLTQNNYYGSSLEQLRQMNLIEVYQRYPELSGENITMLVCDSGFHIKQHRAFSKLKMVAQYDFVYGDPNTDNEPGESPTTANHGTECVSAIAGYDPYTYMGVAPNVSLLLAKTEDTRSESAVEEDNFIAAIEWGEKLGAEIVSASLGYTDWYSHNNMDYNGLKSPLTRVVNIAARYKGIVMVLAAGNEGMSGIGVPADSFDSIAVGAVNLDGGIASFSSRGPSDDGRIKPEVCARGVSTYLVSPLSDSSYLTSSGTSFSTPLVAGAIALILQKNPTWTPYQVRRALLMTSSKASSPDNTYGWGIVNILAAIQFNDSASFESNTFNDSPSACPKTTSLGYLYNSECGWKVNRGVCFNGVCRCYLASSNATSCDISSSASSNIPFVTKCGLHNCKKGICAQDASCQCNYGWSGSDCSIPVLLSISSTIEYLAINPLFILFLIGLAIV